MPGGKRDAADGTASCTALRETREEVGIRPEDINVLAELRPTRTKVPSLSPAPPSVMFTPVAESVSPREPSSAAKHRLLRSDRGQRGLIERRQSNIIHHRVDTLRLPCVEKRERDLLSTK